MNFVMNHAPGAGSITCAITVLRLLLINIWKGKEYIVFLHICSGHIPLSLNQISSYVFASVCLFLFVCLSAGSLRNEQVDFDEILCVKSEWPKEEYNKIWERSGSYSGSGISRNTSLLIIHTQCIIGLYNIWYNA